MWIALTFPFIFKEKQDGNKLLTLNIFLRLLNHFI